MQVPYQEPQTYKISISKITKQPFSPFNSRPVPSLPNHITWQEPSQTTPNIRILSPNNQNIQPKPRRKIFEHEKAKNKCKTHKLNFETKHQKVEQPEKMMRKVKSNTSFKTPSFCEELQLEQRIKEVNRQLAEHRSSRTQLPLTSTQRHQTNKGNPRDFKELEEKLTQSTILMRKQQQALRSKLPVFEQKLEANSNQISQISSMIQTKFQESSLQVSRMMDMVTKNESRLKIKEDQLQKINSELLHKEYQLMKNKEEKKRRDLQLIRIKRIEDLQNKNLQLYQNIQKESFRRFQDLEDYQEEFGNNEVWEDQQNPTLSKFTTFQESTIKYRQPHLNSSREDNNSTLGQILSPLALNDYRF